MKDDFILHNSFAFWIHRINHLLHEDFNKRLKAYDISWPQWMVLNVLASEQASNPAVLAGQLGIDRSGATRLLDRLEKKGYVLREHDKLDRRAVNLILTDKGKELIGSLNKEAYQHQEGFLESLHLSERRNLKKEMQKILKSSGLDTSKLWLRVD